jgi:hypothetical protein
MTDDFIKASREKAKNGYGQVGYQGASSDLPGQHTASGFLPGATLPDSDWQTRPVSSEQKVPTHDSMRSRNHSGGTIPAATIRRDSGK